MHVYNITKYKYHKYYKIQILHMDKYYTRTKPMIELIFRLVNYWYHGTTFESTIITLMVTNESSEIQTPISNWPQ